MRRFNYIFLISIYILSSLLSLAGQGKALLFGENSFTSKNSYPIRLSANVIKIPKHLIPQVNVSIEIHTLTISKENICPVRLIEITRNSDSGRYFDLSIIRPYNKAPPIV